MTSPDYIKISRGWDLIAEGAAEIAQAYAALEQPRAGVSAPLLPAPADELEPLPPLDEEVIPLKPQVDAGLGKCPTHGISWTVKAGGISKNGKPYKAFWKCSEKDGDAFCNEKPQKIWADTHPAERAA